jgi:hypothetical protein
VCRDEWKQKGVYVCAVSIVVHRFLAADGRPRQRPELLAVPSRAPFQSGVVEKTASSHANATCRILRPSI